MAKGGLSDKESVLIAEARAAIARKAADDAAKRVAGSGQAPAAPATAPTESSPRPAVPATARPAPTPTPAPATRAAPAPSAAPPIARAATPGLEAQQSDSARPAKADPAVIAARIAAMMEAEREQTMRRKQKMKQTGTVIVVIGFVPVILWAAFKLIAQLMGR